MIFKLKEAHHKLVTMPDMAPNESLSKNEVVIKAKLCLK